MENTSFLSQEVKTEKCTWKDIYPELEKKPMLMSITVWITVIGIHGTTEVIITFFMPKTKKKLKRSTSCQNEPYDSPQKPFGWLSRT